MQDLRKKSPALAIAMASAFMFTVIAAGCGGSTSSSGSSGATSLYPAAYKAASWSSATTVSFPSDCTMDFTTTGVPPFHNDYYLAPVNSQYPTVVATLPVTGTEVSVQPYTSAGISSNSVTVNICPVKATTTTTAGLGAIGYTLSGEALYNPYEADASTPALEDNASYTFTDGNGVQQTASFIDQCNSHSNGHQWHLHAVPVCLTATVDGATGPSHLLGFAFDGFPVYGGRDLNGNVIQVSQLDSCNGITSATPEFPNGAYHYVLPIGVTGKQSSINCFAGTVSESMMAAARRMMCRPKRAASTKANGV
jgi:hypothetical protein